MKNTKALIIQIIILITIIICFNSCKTLENAGNVDIDSVIFDDQAGVAPKELPQPLYLPLKIKWVSPLHGVKRDTFSPVENGAPVIYKNRVFIGSSKGDLYCLDRQHGKIIWKFKAFGGIESVPAIFGKDVLFGDSDGNIYSLNQKNGRNLSMEVTISE